MKRKRIVPSTKPVTTVVVAGTPQHYCHSHALGKIRAIIISPDENIPVPFDLKPEAKAAIQKAEKPLSKGQKLDNLMNCSERLGKRIQRYLDNWREASDYESKVYWREKLRAAEKADSRVIRKMRELLES